jgi:hypothetical protein
MAKNSGGAGRAERSRLATPPRLPVNPDAAPKKTALQRGIQRLKDRKTAERKG